MILFSLTPFLFQGRDISKVPNDVSHISAKMSELMNCSGSKTLKLNRLTFYQFLSFFKKDTTKNQIILFTNETATNDTYKLSDYKTKLISIGKHLPIITSAQFSVT